MTSFDYDAPNVPDSAVADVVAAICADGKLPELSPEEREARRINTEIYLWECKQRDEQRRDEYQRKQAEAVAAAEREAAIAVAQVREKQRREFRERQELTNRQREMASLHLRVKQQDAWQRGVERAARKSVVQGQYQAQMGAAGQILSALNRAMNPPPEPEAQVVSQCSQGLRFPLVA